VLDGVQVVRIGALAAGLFALIALALVAFGYERPDEHAGDHGDGHGEHGQRGHDIGAARQARDRAGNHKHGSQTHDE